VHRGDAAHGTDRYGLGMIIAFHQTTLLTPGQDRSTQLAQGIYIALVTTLGGLMVAIPSSILAHFFEMRVVTLFHEIDEMLFNLMPLVERYEGRVDLVLGLPARSPMRPNRRPESQRRRDKERGKDKVAFRSAKGRSFERKATKPRRTNTVCRAHDPQERSMAVHIKKSSSLEALNMTPLIDVVFQLLLFFLVATRFAAEDRELDVMLRRPARPGR